MLEALYKYQEFFKKIKATRVNEKCVTIDFTCNINDKMFESSKVNDFILIIDHSYISLGFKENIIFYI